MPIPAFTLDGILPPFLGSEPGEISTLMSPHEVTVADVVNHFSTSDRRKELLVNWLSYRQALRKIGLHQGFQWLGGSFVESKEPDDLDLMLFFRRPSRRKRDEVFNNFAMRNEKLLKRPLVKAKYSLDVMNIDLDGSSEGIIGASSYFLQLFSHQRISFIWRGMLEVRQDDNADDASLLAQLRSDISGHRS